MGVERGEKKMIREGKWQQLRGGFFFWGEVGFFLKKKNLEEREKQRAGRGRW